MRNYINFLLGIVTLVSLGSCSSSSGFIFALHTETFQSKKADFRKVVCINPTYRKFEDSDFDTEDYEFANKFKEVYNQSIEKYSKKNGLTYEVYSPYSEGENLTNYYKDLLPLKSTILKSLNVQDNPMNEVESNTYKKVIIQKFVVPTQLPAELAQLVNKYDTPYFSLVDIYTSHGKSYLFHVVVDLSLGRIEYQEIKGYSNLVKKTEMKMFVYDSFYLLDKFFKK
jgi:hypothetical protein